MCGGGGPRSVDTSNRFLDAYMHCPRMCVIESTEVNHKPLQSANHIRHYRFLEHTSEHTRALTSDKQQMVEEVTIAVQQLLARCR